MSNFKNSILIVAFNYSDCLNNKDYIIDLYKEHFKKIIIYSDFPERKEHQGVNYVDVQKGLYIHRIFNHFYQNYKEDINSCDGLFYTMDDNIINLNILNMYDSSKIIFEEHPSQKLLKKINFQENVATLHLDTSLMPKIKNVWSAWNYNSLHNFESCSDLPVVSYWMNTLQDLQTSQNIFVTLNSENNIRKDLVIKSMKYEHPLFDIDSKIAQSNFKNVQGIKNIWFAGAWLGHGFHEDGFISGKSAAVEVNNKFVTG